MKKNSLKYIFASKVVSMIMGVIFYYAIYTFLDYKFTNMMINAILLYLFSGFFGASFGYSVDDLYMDDAGNMVELTTEEHESEDLELRFKYPKMYLYNQVITIINVVMKITAVIMFTVGFGHYLLN